MITDTIEPLTSKDRRNAFIVDDSIYERRGSAKVELLAKVYDHAGHRYKIGTFFFKKLLEGFITRKGEICGLVMDFLESLPPDIKRFLYPEGVLGPFEPKMGCEV